MNIFLYIILGTALRLINIIKTEGLWNDEYISWYISSIPFNNGFINAILKQCHLPLYYFYLKPFANCSDTILRVTSVIPGIIAIYIMYLLGKEFSKKIGHIAALITTVLPFLIYYSQEVRFYSLLFLFSAISLLFTVKLVKSKTSKNYLLWSLSLILIILTHVLGGIYVLFNFIYTFYKTKKFSKIIIIPLTIGIIIIFTFAPAIIKMIPISQWWSAFSYRNIVFLFTDYFSPILSNNVSAPLHILKNHTFMYNFWLFTPTILAVTGLIFGIKKQKGLFIIAINVVITMSILAILGKIVFITKYSIEILPIFILLTSIGFSDLNKKGLILFLSFLILELSSILTPYHSLKLFRSEGHKLAANLINDANSDVVLLTYYDKDRFERYLSKDLHGTFYSINKSNRFIYKDHPEEILKNVKRGETVSVLILETVSYIPAEIIDLVDKKKQPEMFLTFSTIKNGIVEYLNNNYKDFEIERSGAWLLITGTKK